MKLRLSPESAEDGADERHFALLEKIAAVIDENPRNVVIDVLMNVCAMCLLEMYGREAPERSKDFAKEVRRCILKNAHTVTQKKELN